MLITRSNKPYLLWASITGTHLDGTFAFICWQQMNLLFQASAERSEVFPQEGRLLPGGELGMGALAGWEECGVRCWEAWGRDFCPDPALQHSKHLAGAQRGATRHGQYGFALNCKYFPCP